MIRYYKVNMPCGDSFRVAERHIIEHRSKTLSKGVPEDVFESEFHFLNEEARNDPTVVVDWIKTRYPATEILNKGMLMPQGKDVEWDWEKKNSEVEVLEL